MIRRTAIALLAGLLGAVVVGDPVEAAKPGKNCVSVTGRWYLCGSKKGTVYTAWVGFRFMEVLPNGDLVAQPKIYESCAALGNDRSVAVDLRSQAYAVCQREKTRALAVPAE